MKNLIFILLLVGNFVFSQKKEFVLIDSQTKKEIVKKDSLSAVNFLDSLAQNSYYFTKVLSVEIKENSTRILFDKGKNYNEAYVKISDSLAVAFKIKPNFYTKNLDSLKQAVNKKFVQQGFVFSRVKSKLKTFENDVPSVEISVKTNGKRTIDAFKIKGYEKAPKRFVKNIEKEFKGKTYNEKTLSAIHQSLSNHAFVTLEKPPQTLFTKDSTSIFLFLQKKKTNTFDGVIGFGNDKTEKFTFNGTMNIAFRNMFNGFESLSLYWQRNPDKGQTFDLKTDIPYMLGSNIGFNVNVNIFRQDSTFANVKLHPSVYLHISNRQKIGFRGTFETSTVMDSLYAGKDYNRNGFGLWYDYAEPTEIELFQYTTKIRAEADYLTTRYTKDDTKANQMHYFFLGERNFHIGGNHYLNLKGETALLSSRDPFTSNELLRFGGWNSLRGFNEESLYADFYYFGNAEYRYVVGNQAFFDVFLQYGQLNNKTLNVKPKLYSVGLGFNFFLPIGLMTFQISNGNEMGNPFKFNDTKIHWGLLSRF